MILPSHKRVLSQLAELAASNRVPHALLLYGPTGIGKFQVAKTFAQYLHCEHPGPDGMPCGECDSCRQSEAYNHVDTMYVFPVVKTDKLRNAVSDDYMAEFKDFVRSSPFMDFDKWAGSFDKKNAQPMIYVNESEQIEQRLSVTNARSRYKVVVIWLPEKMNEAAANKLLKLIEEPLGETVFILVSDDAPALLPTIRSRCRPVEMTRPADTEVAQYLVDRAGLDPTDAMAEAHVAGGNINAALRGLDATSASRMFFDYFVSLMRLAYQRDVAGLKAWATDLTALGREMEVRFYDYCTRLVRENFIYNFNLPEISYLNRAETQFSRNFARFITENNAERMTRHMDRAAADIAGNANGKIVNFDFAIKMIILIKEQ